MSRTVRRATVDDLPGVSKVARLTDQSGEGAGDDPRYSAHILERGRLFVAEVDRSIVGYGATVRVNGVDMLTDLFIIPERQGQGIGKELLDVVWSGTDDRMTLSSSHPSALPLYLRFGMAPLWPVLYLRGESTLAPPGYLVLDVDAAECALREQELTGIDRSQDYAYWAARPQSRLVVVRFANEVVAVGAVGGAGSTYGVSHLVAAAPQYSADSLLAVLSTLTGRLFLTIPGPHLGVAPLIGQGWRLVDVDQFVATASDLVDPALLCPHSGLM